MRIKIRSRLIVFALTVLLSITTVFSIKAFAENENYEWNSVSLQEYYVGDVMTVPVATVKSEDVEYPTEFSLKFPDGKVYSDDDKDVETVSEFILPYSGNYELTYFTKIDGKYVSKKVEFEVKERLFSVSSAMSSVEYEEVECVSPSSQLTKKATGLHVKLASGDTFQYNKLVDLNDLPSLATILNFHVLPNVDGELDVSGITVILTDAYDLSNTVEIKVKARAEANTKDKWDWTYLSACAPSAGQVTTGYAKNGNPEVQVDTVFGAGRQFSFYGSSWDKSLSALDRSMPINFNNSEKAVYVDDTLVVDLDDSFFFSNLWSGFTTSKVFVSVVGNTYYKESVNLLITELCGQKLNDENLLLKESEPEFYVDASGMDLENVMTVLGYKFPVFNVNAVDGYDGALPVSVKAFYGYHSSMKNELDILDGYFIADKMGVITLEYSVKSYSGIVYKKLVDVLVKDEEQLSIEFMDGYCQQGVAGDVIKLADYVVNGNIGLTTNNASVVCNGEKVQIINNTFKPISEGVYTVVVEITDAIGQKTQLSYEVSVSENKTPVFFGDVVVPKYFIVGKEYILPDFNAYDYATNTEKLLESKVFVNGIEGKVFTPTAEGEVVVEYVAQTDNGKAVKKYMGVAVLAMNDDKTIIHSKYFDSENMSATLNSNGLNFSVKDANNRFTFINYLSAYDFSVDFTIAPDKRQFKFFDIYLTDPIFVENQLKISVEIATLKIYVNDLFTGIFAEESALFDGTGKNFVSVGFDSRQKLVSISGSTYQLDEELAFSGNLVLFSASLRNATGEAGFSIKKICNQVWKSTVKKDNMEPIISYNGNYDRYLGINTEIEIFSAVFSDVLNPLNEHYVSVKGSNGYLTSLDGIKLEKVDATRSYKVLLDAYGEYDVEYYTKDNAGKEKTDLIKINVIDKEAPTITLKGNSVVQAKLGDVIKLPAVNVDDNVDKDLTVSVILYTCDTGFRKVLTDTKFRVTELSDYIVMFICYDSAGNMGMESFTVKVER